MDVSDASAGPATLGPAAACSDGERRSAVSARDTLRRAGHAAHLQTEWVRPGWPGVFAFHGALAIAGSLLSAAGAALAGLVLVGVAALSLFGELSGRARLMRLLLPARATQNLVAEPPMDSARPRLIVYANLDAPRPRRTSLPPALLWTAILGLVLLAALRVDGVNSNAVTVAQFVLCMSALAGVAALVELVFAGAGEASPAAATALALFLELRRRRLQGCEAGLVLGGAGDGQGLGLARYLRASEWRAEDVVLLSIEHSDRPVGWRTRDGQLLALRMHPRLCELMAHAAAGEARLGARARRTWNCSGAYVARREGWPSIAVEGADAEAVLELCLAWVGLLDAELAQNLAPKRELALGA